MTATSICFGGEARVRLLAIQNAASVAGLLITTEVLVAELPEPSRPPGAGRIEDMAY